MDGHRGVPCQRYQERGLVWTALGLLCVTKKGPVPQKEKRDFKAESNEIRMGGGKGERRSEGRRGGGGCVKEEGGGEG